MNEVNDTPEEATPTTLKPEEVEGSGETVVDDAPPPDVLVHGSVIVAGTTPIQLDASTVGDFLVDLLAAYLPCNEGDDKHKEIAKDYAGKGTTCGFLVHWALWRIRFLDPHITNRTEPDDGLKYHDGANISRVWNGGKPPFKRFNRGDTPETGDIVFISNGPPLTEHVCIFLSSKTEGGVTRWTTADGGQYDPKTGKYTAMKFVTRVFDGRQLISPTSTRCIVGTIPVRSLTLAPGAIPVMPRDA